MKAPLVALALALLSAPALAQSIEYGKDRLGADIGSFSLPANSVPENCQGACQANSGCAAWTFARSGWQGATPRCWLKNAAPAPTDNFCCVSGHRQAP
ncbi:PAN domain-containing protein [Bradyrhizobium sp. USDA 10063]